MFLWLYVFHGDWAGILGREVLCISGVRICCLFCFLCVEGIWSWVSIDFPWFYIIAINTIMYIYIWDEIGFVSIAVDKKNWVFQWIFRGRVCFLIVRCWIDIFERKLLRCTVRQRSKIGFFFHRRKGSRRVEEVLLSFYAFCWRIGGVFTFEIQRILYLLGSWAYINIDNKYRFPINFVCFWWHHAIWLIW